MAIVRTSYGEAQNKTAATTVVLTTTATIPAYTFLVIGICADNTSATAPTITGITAVGGGTWTNRAGSVSQSGASATALTGVFVYCYTLYTTTEVASGTNITVTFNASPTAKAVELWGFSEMNDALRSTVVSGASTGGTPSATTAGSALVAGDLVIGVAGAENNVVMTGDADTLNGTWSAIDGVNTTGGNAQTNTVINIQHKIVTATGAQTFNPTNGVADSVAIVFAVVPAAFYTVDTSDAVGVTDTFSTTLTKKAETLVDTFDTGIDPAKWPIVYGNTVWEASGRVAATANNSYSGINTAYNSYDLEDSSVFVKATRPAVEYRSSETTLCVYGPTNQNGLWFILYYDQRQRMYTFQRQNGVDEVVYHDLYDPVAHAYIRLRKDETNVYWDTSPDGIVWTNLRTLASTLDLSVITIEVSVGQWQTEAAAVTGYFDYVNTAPEFTLNDFVGVTDTVLPHKTIYLDRSDAVGIAASTTEEIARGHTDSLGITYTVTKDATHPHSDPVGITDLATVLLTIIRDPAADSVGVPDSVSTFVMRGASGSDPVGITESRVLAATKVWSDSMGTTDASITKAVVKAPPSDPVSVPDSTVRAVEKKPATESVGITDSVVTLKTALVPKTEPIGVTDSRTLFLSATRTDPIAVTYSFKIPLAISRPLQVGITDRITVLLSKSLGTDRWIRVADSVLTSRHSSSALLDKVGSTETITKSLVMVRNYSDSLSLADVVQSGGRGQPTIWTGTWEKKPSMVWNGTQWVEKPWRTWNGTDWETS